MSQRSSRALLGGALVLSIAAGCGGPPPDAKREMGSPAAPAAQAPAGGSNPIDPPDAEMPPDAAPFIDVTGATGLDFDHWNGMSGGLYYSEMMGSGGALFDVDGDGDLDLYLVQGARLGDRAPSRPPDQPTFDRLYRNDLAAPGATPRFVDVTEAAGLATAAAEASYGMGAVAADFDGDGHADLYITAAGRNRHLRNQGDGTFEEVTDEVSGIERWSVPAVVLDIDLDGRNDLFVGHYVDYSIAIDKQCVDELGQRNYCGPLAYAPLADSLLRNVGGRFEDLTGRLGLATATGAALGATASDFNGDDRLDLYVANDGTPNRLWLAQPDGTFIDRALLAGAALNGQGHAEASMGVAVGDVDGDLDDDLLLTHLTRETNTLYRNDRGAFVDRSAESGLGAPSFDRTGFGAAWVDLENDGRLDLVVGNGAVKIIKEQRLAGDRHPLHQRDQLFAQQADGRFREVGDAAGPAFAPSLVTRGVLAGDLDDDGDLDLVLTANDGPARVLLNRQGQDAPWVGLRLVNAQGADVAGALALVTAADGRRFARRVVLGSSYAGSNDPRLLFGLGGDGSPDGLDGAVAVEVVWPGGMRERWSDLAVGQYHHLRRGDGAS
ncbi:MAG: CRTAC1 family protein [Acidobacteriota bacterium]